MVGAGDHETFLYLLLRGVSEMANGTALAIDLVRVDVGDGRDIRVRGLAVVTFVVVVGQDFPVVVPLHLPLVVKLVVVKVVQREARLLIDAAKVLLPWNLRLILPV